jgi:hypothetical protein
VWEAERVRVSGGGGVVIHPRHGGATRLGAEAGSAAAAGVICDTPAAIKPCGIFSNFKVFFKI